MATPAAVTAPRPRATTFVVVQVRQALQQVGAIGAYSAALFVIGAALTDSFRSIARVEPSARIRLSATRADDVRTCAVGPAPRERRASVPVDAQRSETRFDAT